MEPLVSVGATRPRETHPMNARHRHIPTIPPRKMWDRQVLMQKLPFRLVKIFLLSKVVPRQAAPGKLIPYRGLIIFPISDFIFEILAQPFNEPVLNLTHPLPGNLVPSPDLLQGHRLFRQQA